MFATVMDKPAQKSHTSCVVEYQESTCPRCGHIIPSDRVSGMSTGMPSRCDDLTEVCFACARHEAVLQRNGRAATRSEWPIEVPQGLYEMYYADPA